jgi:hypothetical protein
METVNLTSIKILAVLVLVLSLKMTSSHGLKIQVFEDIDFEGTVL